LDRLERRLDPTDWERLVKDRRLLYTADANCSMEGDEDRSIVIIVGHNLRIVEENSSCKDATSDRSAVHPIQVRERDMD